MKKFFILLFSVIILNLACDTKTNEEPDKETELKNAKVTFIELGSVSCIPCKQMQPVMKAIEEKYGDQVNVVFYDVWKPEQKHFAEEYGIKLIPTQVFIDENGEEFHRHEGFYPEEAIDKILQEKGLVPIKKG